MSENAILVDGLRKTYGAVTALDGISFAVPAGEVFALLGPNGAGKTTAVRILTTTVAPDAGRASVLGYDTVRQAGAVRHRIGLAGQSAAVDLKLTGRENLWLIGRLTRVQRWQLPGRVDELLARFDLAGVADRPVRTYSGGLRRRLDVAAALVHRPPVLFLDEPTTGLDVQSRGELWAMVQGLVNDGTTVVLTTQYLDEADQRAHRVMVLDKGRVIADGTPGQLKAQLRSAVVDLTFPDDRTAAHAEQLLAGRGGVGLVRDGASVCLPADAGSATIVEVVTFLQAHGLVPATLALREPSLDEVFLALTGGDGNSRPVADEEDRKARHVSPVGAAARSAVVSCGPLVVVVSWPGGLGRRRSTSAEVPALGPGGTR
jgi:ABC-2 type transport system ATP-binding protein